MKHKHFKTLLIHSQVEPLKSDDAAALRMHLAECQQCRAEATAMDALRAGEEALKDLTAIDASLLQEARQELRVLLRRENATRSAGRVSLLYTLALSHPRISAGLSFALVLAVGVGIGRWYVSLPEYAAGSHLALIPAGGAQPAGEPPRVANVHFITYGGDSQPVEFTFDAVTPTHVRGSLDDPMIQKLLVEAILTDDNPGVRLKAMDAIRATGMTSADTAIRTALLHVLRSDPNIGVRKQAMVALHAMPLDGPITSGFLDVLMREKNPGLRIAAINALIPLLSKPDGMDPRLREVLERKAQSDNNGYIRLRAKSVLLERQ
jgi:hypothetical protein